MDRSFGRVVCQYAILYPPGTVMKATDANPTATGTQAVIILQSVRGSVNCFDMLYFLDVLSLSTLWDLA